jgi:hypothetical protein
MTLAADVPASSDTRERNDGGEMIELHMSRDALICVRQRGPLPGAMTARVR